MFYTTCLVYANVWWATKATKLLFWLLQSVGSNYSTLALCWHLFHGFHVQFSILLLFYNSFFLFYFLNLRIYIVLKIVFSLYFLILCKWFFQFSLYHTVVLQPGLIVWRAFFNRLPQLLQGRMWASFTYRSFIRAPLAIHACGSSRAEQFISAITFIWEAVAMPYSNYVSLEFKFTYLSFLVYFSIWDRPWIWTINWKY